jgi:hypothetical protein
MWSWLPGATSVLDFGTAAIGFTLAGLAIVSKVRRPEPPVRGKDEDHRAEDED